jgi:hypothetical protein
MLLRRFTNADGQLHVYRKVDRKFWSAAPDGVFLERHLYSSVDEDGVREPELERAYSQLEGDAQQIINKFIEASETGNAPDLSPDEKGIWTLFFYQQMKRVPEMFRKLDAQRNFADRLDDAIAKLEARIGRKLTEEELGDLRAPGSLARIQQNATLKALADPGQVVQTLLLTMPLHIEVASSDAPFVITSQPIARISDGNTQDIRDPSVFLCLPIASNVAVRFAATGAPISVRSISDSRVLRINQQLYAQSEMIAAATKVTIDSLVASETNN